MTNPLNTFRRFADAARGGRLERIVRRPIRFPRSLLRQRVGSSPRSYHTDLFWGESMEVMYPEIVSVFIDRYGFFEEDLTTFALKYLKPGMTVLDIGGHFGYFTRLAEFVTRGGGSVHTFEPTPSTYSVLEKNTARFPAIHLEQLAVSNVVGSIPLKDYGIEYAAFNTIADGKVATEAPHADNPTSTDVTTIPLDEYVASRNLKPDFVKIDAEGAEPLIISGMESVLKNDRPTVSLEGDGSDDKKTMSCVSTFVEHGYDVIRFNQETRDFDTVDTLKPFKRDNLFFVHASRRAA